MSRAQLPSSSPASRNEFNQSLDEIREGNITHIKFGVLGLEEIRAQSVTTGRGITEPVGGYGAGEAMDSRMGVSWGNSQCSTCSKGRVECGGHLGHIDFTNIGPREFKVGEDVKTAAGVTRSGLMFYHPFFMAYIVDLLRIQCHNCYRIRVKPEILVLEGLINKSLVSSACLKAEDVKDAPDEEDEDEGADVDEKQLEIEESNLGLDVTGNVDDADVGGDEEIKAASSLAAEASGVSAEQTDIQVAEDKHSYEERFEMDPEESLAQITSHVHKLAVYISNKLGNSPCWHCGKLSNKIDSGRSTRNRRIYFPRDKRTKDDTGVMPIRMAFDILSRMTPGDQKILQVESPSRFIIRALAVLPPRLRAPPYVAGKRRTNYITQLYIEILKFRHTLEAMAPDNMTEVQRAHQIRVWREEVYDADFNKYYLKIADTIAALMDNTKSTAKIRSEPDRNMPTLTHKVAGKMGLMRHAMNSKRVRLTARAHLLHLKGLDYDQIGISPEIAEGVSKPETMTSRNKDRLLALAKAGKIKYVIRRGDVKRRVLRKLFSHQPPQIGDVVFRPLQDGDVVAGGRQPTIHKTSMMGYRVKIIPGLRGFAISMAVTMYHNGDFDGDEFTIHVPYDPETEDEIAVLMSPTNYILNAENNMAGVALTFNALTAATHLTDRKELVDEKLYALLLQDLKESKSITQDKLNRLPELLRLYDVNPRSGSGIFSLILPTDMLPYNRGDVIIRDGVLIKGNITTDDIGRSGHGIIHTLALDPNGGLDKARDFLNNANRLVNFYLDNVGFSLSLQDCLLAKPAASITASRQKIIGEVKAQRDRIQAEVEYIVQTEPAVTDYEKRRRKQLISAKLDQLANMGVELVKKHLGGENPIAYLTRSGAKGNIPTVAQQAVQVGQQYSFGEIIEDPEGYEKRTLSYAHPDSIAIENHGNVTSPYSQGLWAREYFAHSLASREQLMDTGINTPLSGDMQRRMTKIMEGCVIDVDGTVRNGDTVDSKTVGDKGRIIQGRYTDGFDGSKLFGKKIQGRNVLTFVDVGAMVSRINSSFMGGSDAMNVVLPSAGSAMV